MIDRLPDDRALLAVPVEKFGGMVTMLMSIRCNLHVAGASCLPRLLDP